MSLYNDLNTVLTPYANKIKRNESDIGDIQDALDHLDVETGDALSALEDQFSEETDQLKADLADVKNDTTEYTTVFESTEWINNSNSAVQSNGDGTYNVGTSDYGTTVFGATEVLDAGEYYLFGIATDKGFTFISLSTNVNNAIDTNDTKAIKKITISERRAYYIGMKMASKPTSAFVATPILLKSVKKIDELRTDVDSLDSKISTLSDIEGKILDDINISDISAQTMMHTAGDASVTFNSTNGFEYQRVTAQNNIVGFKIPTLPKKEYTVTFSISGLYDGSISVYVCPAYEFNTGGALASDVDITSDKVVNFSFTATTAKSSLWFSISYRTTSVTILNVDINDGIIRYKLPTIMDYKGREISVFNKIACVGDSITEGTFNYTSGGTNANVVNISKYSYPSILTKLTGVTTSNLGRGGRTSVEWYDLFKNEDLSGYDAVIIMLGINDGVYATQIADFTTAICNIIDKFKQENNGIRIFLATIIPAYTDYDSKFDAYNTEIRRIASEEYTDVVLVDINRYSGCKKDTSYAQGHLTAIGYRKLAEEFSILISYEMYKNPHAFRNIQFIGTEYTYE